VVLEKEPVKVAVSYLPHWETLMMLGVMPIATTSAEHYASTWDAFKGLDLSSVTDLGDSEVNLELLAELEPDIILEQASDVNNVDVTNLEKISKVAVFGQEVKMDWRYALREIGKVVNKDAKAEEVIAEVDAKLADAKTKLQDKYNGQTVMLMSMMGEDQYYCAYRPDLYDAEKGLGLVTPEGFTTSETYEQISMEALVEMNPDYLFVNVFDGDEALFEELSNNSVWNSLTAVKNGHVYTLDGSGHAASAMSTVYTVDFIIKTLLSE
jgi:iron complex transport system substrate-binding protein